LIISIGWGAVIVWKGGGPLGTVPELLFEETFVGVTVFIFNKQNYLMLLIGG